MKLHIPLFKAIAASIIPYCVMLIIEQQLFGTKPVYSSETFIIWFFVGYFYANFFEWWYHNYWLHKWKTPLRVGHGYHHAKLHGIYFRTRDPERLRATTTNWYIFPTLFETHYLGFVTIFGHENATVFFLGIIVHFTFFYEIAHWLTHVNNNVIDRFIEKIPFFNMLRAMQIEHHRIHHAKQKLNFNFSPPYSGDHIFKTKK